MVVPRRAVRCTHSGTEDEMSKQKIDATEIEVNGVAYVQKGSTVANKGQCLRTTA